MHEFIQGGAIALLLLLAAILWRLGGAPRLWAMSCVGAAAYVLAASPVLSHGEWGRLPLRAIAATGPLWHMMAVRGQLGQRALLTAVQLNLSALALAALAVIPAFISGTPHRLLTGLLDLCLIGLFVVTLHASWNGVARQWSGNALRPIALVTGSAAFGAVVATAAFGSSVWGVSIQFHQQVRSLAAVGTLILVWVYCSIVLTGRPLPIRPQAAPPPSALVEKIRAAFAQSKVHRNPDLTLSTVARTLQVPEHQVRYAIIDGLGYKNFSDLTNSHRLEEVKTALADQTQIDVSIGTIALDAGFGSLASFNRVFKATLGVSPSEWRRQHCA